MAATVRPSCGGLSRRAVALCAPEARFVDEIGVTSPVAEAIGTAVRRLAFSTDDVPEAERFAYWREAVSEGLIGVSGERDRDQEISFTSRVDAWIGPSLARLRYRGDAYHVFRRPREIARIGWDEYFLVYRECSIGASFSVDRREFVTKPGDLVITELTVPFATEARADFNHDSWLFPRKLFEPHLAASQHPRSLVMRDDDGLYLMVKA
jgi:hypothetical protein